MALLISLLLHLLLMNDMRFNWVLKLPGSDVIEARLEPLPSIPQTLPKAKSPAVKPVRPKSHRHSHRHSHRPVHQPPPLPPASVTPPEPTTPPELTAPSVSATAAAPPVTAPPPSGPVATVGNADNRAGKQDAAAVNTPAPVLNSWPTKIELEYKLVKGINGFGIGKASYIWVARDGQYTLTSITEATGLLALFQSGRLVQISHGKITASGLAPDDFWIQRGSSMPDKTTAAHFDYVHQSVTITKDNRAFSVPMLDNAQDLLSVIFQLAIRAPFPDGMLLHVTTGKALKPYHALVVGEETIATPLGPLRTLHLTRPAEEDEDAMDIWLAEDYNYIPVKIRVKHSQFGIIEQVLTGMQSH